MVASTVRASWVPGIVGTIVLREQCDAGGGSTPSALLVGFPHPREFGVPPFPPGSLVAVGRASPLEVAGDVESVGGLVEGIVIASNPSGRSTVGQSVGGEAVESFPDPLGVEAGGCAELVDGGDRVRVQRGVDDPCGAAETAGCSEGVVAEGAQSVVEVA